jgi:hypothetical protein
MGNVSGRGELLKAGCANEGADQNGHFENGAISRVILTLNGFVFSMCIEDSV